MPSLGQHLVVVNEKLDQLADAVAATKDAVDEVADVTPTDVNIVSVVNSTNTPLGAFDVFTGAWVNVTDFSSISVACTSDQGSQFSGVRIQWSTDGVTSNLPEQRFTFDPLAISQGTFRVHATVAAPFFRLLYENGFQAQATFVLVTLLRKGTPTATVRTLDPVNTFAANLDVGTVQAILSGRGRFNGEQIQMVRLDDVDLPNDGPFLFVTPRPGQSDAILRRTTAASLVPVRLNTTPGAVERPYMMSIVNSVQRGNLFLKLDASSSSGLTTTQFDAMVPPGHEWHFMSKSGTGWPGHVYGVWDEVYVNDDGGVGSALFVVAYYG